MREILRKIGEWTKKHPLVLVIVIATFVINLGGVPGKISALRALVDWVVQTGTKVNTQSNSVTTVGWFFCLSVVIPTCAILLGILCVRGEIVLRQTLRQRESRIKTAGKTLEGMMLAAYRIREQLVPAAQQPLKVLVTVKNTYLIHENFDTEVRREYEVRASDLTVHFWEIKLGVESTADGVEYLDDINFKAVDESGLGHDIKYLPSRNDARRKKVVLFFLPQIEPGEAEARRIVISYRWPGMLKGLRETGSELFTWDLESREPIRHAEFQFFLEEGTGGNLECEIAGPQSGTQRLQETTHPDSKWPGWVYTIDSVPNDEYAVTLRLKRP